PLSMEEAVNNILYNTPSPTRAPTTRHVLNGLVSNEPGVLARVAGVLAGRGFNIESLVVARTEVPDLSRMTIVLDGQTPVVQQARKQLEDLVPVWAVLDYTDTRFVERELLLVKVSAMPHEHWTSPGADGAPTPAAATAAAAAGAVSPLLRTALQRNALRELADLFHGRVVDVTLRSMIIELSAKPERVDAFLRLLAPFGVIEAARSGSMAMPRSALDARGSCEEAGAAAPAQRADGVDVTQLPPG
ncbi:hypothetical protein CXG81DRAFT_7735, partial [Caulochytrium protostelioides]